MEFRYKILRIMQKHRLIPPNSTIIVGVSGGADSLALLHVLYRLRNELSYKIVVATLNHQLRGEAGRDDAEYVRRVSNDWELPVIVNEIDVRARAKAQGVGVEEAGRMARYEFFARVAHDVSAHVVAVAHHADDQAETVLMRIIRGTGVQGLGGMTLRSRLPGHADLTLIRPFLHITRTEIIEYCAVEDLTPRDDATNRDTTVVRNAIRHDVLPQLEHLNPGVRRVLTQLADIMAIENDFISQQLMDMIAQHVSMEDNRVMIGRAGFDELHPALRRRVVLWAVQQVSDTHKTTRYERIVAAVDVASHGQVGAVLEFPDDVRMRIDYDSLVIEHTADPLRVDALLLPEDTDEITISIPGTTRIPGTDWSLRAEFRPSSHTNAPIALDGDRVVELRTRRASDRLAPPGMNGHTQKLKQWLINRKIPRALRNRLPLLIIDGEIAVILVGDEWVVSEPFVLRDETDATHTIYLSVVNNESL